MNKDNWMYKKTQLSKESKSENQSAGKSSAHLVDNRPSSVAQRKQNGEAPIQKKANNTGLPNNLKSGINLFILIKNCPSPPSDKSKSPD